MSGAVLISCCYCGAQDIFKIHKGKRRQLSCLSCGAQMRKMTPIKVTEPIAKPKVAANPTPTPSVDARDKYKSKYEKYKSKYDKSKRHAAYHKKRKKKKGWVAELWDDLDDIFDIDDWFD
jgi:hypothetical protein